MSGVGRPRSPHRQKAEADVQRVVGEAQGIYKPSLRNLWYKVVHYVKPEYFDPKSLGKAYKHFVHWVTEMRKAGVLADDALVDEGRSEHDFPTWDTPDSLLEDAAALGRSAADHKRCAGDTPQRQPSGNPGGVHPPCYGAPAGAAG